mmetsp:Transcript_68226/g.142588  ORF Transcript_68226/g.142588 Transcript_68226/m.142588 type:complete len:121 (+) Transcript_68226:987-1349(+)
MFKPAVRSFIAIRGEAAPIVSVRLEKDVSSGYNCEASLMSGASAKFWLPAWPFRVRWLWSGDTTPLLEDLACRLRDELTDATTVPRIFLSFVTDDEDGEHLIVSPWDANRPLEDFCNPRK